LKNNVLLDVTRVGINVARSNYPTFYEKFDVNNNLYYNCGWGEPDYNGGIGAVKDSTVSVIVAHTLYDLHNKITPHWETTNYSFYPQYKKFPSQYDLANLSYNERFVVSYFDDGVFDVTPELQDKGSSSLPQALKDILNYFNIADIKNGDKYDLGPFEAGKGSWLPSSKKDKDRNKYSPDQPVISSAHSFYLSIPLLLVCFLFAMNI